MRSFPNHCSKETYLLPHNSLNQAQEHDRSIPLMILDIWASAIMWRQRWSQMTVHGHGGSP